MREGFIAIERGIVLFLSLGFGFDYIKGLRHGQKCIHLNSDSEAYYERMGLTPSSNGNLPIAPRDALFRQPMQQNWPRDRKLAQSCWCLH